MRRDAVKFALIIGAQCDIRRCLLRYEWHTLRAGIRAAGVNPMRYRKGMIALSEIQDYRCSAACCTAASLHPLSYTNS